MSENIEVKKTELVAAKPAVKKPMAPKPGSVATTKPAPAKPVLKSEALEPVKSVVVQEARPIDPKAQAEARLEMERQKDHVPVKGVFRNLETPGGILKFPFKKYKKDKVVTYTLVDGATYEIPLMVANHLNDNCYTPRYALIPNSDIHQAIERYGVKGMMPVGKNSRFAFQPLGFLHHPYEQKAIMPSSF